MDDRVVAEEVRKRFGPAVVLDGASLTFRRGETLALLGRNGAGKTTLVRILVGAVSKDSGRVEVLGRDIDRAPGDIAHLCGWAGQDSERSAYPRLTVRENLRFFGALRGIPRRTIDARVHLLAQELGFAARLDAFFGTLSGGQKQVAIIARALLHDPPVAFLDEPTKGLDLLAAHRVRAFLRRQVSCGMALLLTSHILDDLDALADRVAVVDQGRVRIEASPAALVAALGAKDALEVERALGPGAPQPGPPGARGVG